MQSDDPAFLPVGTEVSAKFKGAFCEAKVKKVTKSVKLKVTLKEAPFGTIQIDETSIVKGQNLMVNEPVEVAHGKQTLKGLISNVKDYSTYHVVFNDGDEKVLRRSQMCLKGAKHFDAAVNLDALPLYNPEQFSSPVVKSSLKKAKKRKVEESPSKRKKRRENDEESDEEKAGKKREKRAAASAANVAIGEMDHGDTEVSEETSSADEAEIEKEKKKREKEPKEKEKEDREKEKKEKEPKDKKDKKEQGSSGGKAGKESAGRVFEPGEVFCIFEDATKKGRWFPAIIVAAKAYKENALKPRALTKKEVAIRSFQNGKFLAIAINQITPFESQSINKKYLESLTAAQKTGIDRAQSYLENGTLPSSWDSKDVHGETSKKREKDDKKEKKETADDKNEKHTAERGERREKDTKEKKPPRGEEKKKREPKKEDERVKDSEREKEKEDREREKRERKEEREKKKEEAVKEEKKDEDKSDGSSDPESEWSDEEPGEERDHFVAQLYKFQDERGTPINRAPILGGKDIDLYKLYRVVQHYGGGKKVTQNSLWKKVLTRMDLEGCSGATPVTIKKAYVRYLSHFTTLYKTLCWSLDDTSSQPGSSTSRGDRRLFRAISDKDGKSGGISKRRRSVVGEKEGSNKDQKEGSKERSGSVVKKEKSIDEDGKSVELTSDDPYEMPYSGPITSGPLELTNIRATLEKEVKRESASPAVSLASSERSKKADKLPVAGEEKLPPGQKDETQLEKKKFKKKKEDETTTQQQGNEGEGEVKKKREKKRLSMRDRAERKSMSCAGGEGENAKDEKDEGYNAADIFSHFYMGQKVRALHIGKWYDARVLEIKQLDNKELLKLLTKGNNTTAELSQDILKELLKVMAETRCFVHYLGWNARYDEWIPLDKIRIGLKDAAQSMELLRKAREAATKEAKPNISDERVQWIVDWCKSPQGVFSLRKDDDPQQVNTFNAMGNNYRPRKVSSSQLEQLSNEQLRREKDKTTSQSGSATSSSTGYPLIGSPASSTKSPPPVAILPPTPSTQPTVPFVQGSPKQSAQQPTGSPKPLAHGSLAPTPSIASGPLTIDSLAGEQSTSGPISSRSKKEASTLLPSCTTPASSTLVTAAGPLIIATDKLSPRQSAGADNSKTVQEVVIEVLSKEKSPPASKLVKSELETSSSAGIFAHHPGKDMKRMRTFSRDQIHLDCLQSPTSPQKPSGRTLSCYSTDTIPAYANESELDFRDDEHERKPSSASLSTTTSPTVDDVMERRPEATPTPERRSNAGKRELKALVGSKREELPIKSKRKRRESTQNEDELKQEKLEKSPEEEGRQEDDIESGLVTPRTADNDNESDKMSVSDAGASSSLQRTPRGKTFIKRKRGAHNKHSQMVVDKKYIKKEKRANAAEKAQEKEEDSDEEEEEGGTTACRDTYLSMKNRMHRQLEQENQLKDVSILGIEDLATLMSRTPADQLTDALEARLNDLRDIYYQAKNDYLKMERRRKQHNEKKKEKEKAQRDQSLTSAAGSEK